jgi:hypothetical protein
VTTTFGTFHAIQNSNGNVVVSYVNGTLYATVFKLTGTVEAGSTLSLGIPNKNSLDSSDLIVVATTKALVVSGNNDSNAYVNTLVDTAGVISVGTPLVLSIAGTANAAVATYSLANIVGVSLPTAFMSIDCSGSSPVLNALRKVPVVLGTASTTGDRNVLRSGSVHYVTPNATNPSLPILRVTDVALSYSAPVNIAQGNAIPGNLTPSQQWLGYTQGTGIGQLFQLMECTA